MSNVGRSNKREVKLPEVHVGLLLQEVTRAFMHGGLPSALLARLETGVGQYLLECENEVDRVFVASFAAELKELHAKWRTKEDNAYL